MRGSYILPVPRPGARLCGATPFIEVTLEGVVFRDLPSALCDCNCCKASIVLDVLLRSPPPMSRSVNVMKKSDGNVVPKNAPSTVWNLELGGVYTSKQEGQNSLTVSWPGLSLRPTGSTLQELQCTRGHVPKC